MDAFLMKLNQKTHARSTRRILQPLMGVQTRANPKYSLFPPLSPRLETCTECTFVLSAVSQWGFTTGLLYVLHSLLRQT